VRSSAEGTGLRPLDVNVDPLMVPVASANVFTLCWVISSQPLLPRLFPASAFNSSSPRTVVVITVLPQVDVVATAASHSAAPTIPAGISSRVVVSGGLCAWRLVVIDGSRPAGNLVLADAAAEALTAVEA
jgi:hypothetical protein